MDLFSKYNEYQKYKKDPKAGFSYARENFPKEIRKIKDGVEIVPASMLDEMAFNYWHLCLGSSFYFTYDDYALYAWFKKNDIPAPEGIQMKWNTLSPERQASILAMS